MLFEDLFKASVKSRSHSFFTNFFTQILHKMEIKYTIPKLNKSSNTGIFIIGMMVFNLEILWLNKIKILR
jgi:hypothetical protein